jgi:hypothetical protein
MSETCKNCRYSSWPIEYYYEDQGTEQQGGPRYKCRRRAPIPTGGMMSPAWTVWPRVHADGWCGEWQAKEAGK